jgi:hypothetical protein
VGTVRAPSRLLAAAVAVIGLVVLQAPSQAAPSKTYAPPFALGPSGGDSDGFSSADPGGRIIVGRMYPAPGPISCPGGGQFATFKVVHKVTAPVHKVSAAYTEALVDPYVYVSIGVRDATGRWIGSRKIGGATNAGTFDVPVRWDRTIRGPLQVIFGLELSTACPHADGGTIRFTSLTVSG